MVKLASTLPKEHERNGLEARTRDLIDTYSNGATVAIVAIVRARTVTDTADYERVPQLEVLHVEAAGDEHDAELRRLLQDMHDNRVRHVKQPLDLGDDITPTLADDLAEITAAAHVDADVVDAELVQED